MSARDQLLTEPTCYRSAINEGAADISRGYIVKQGAAALGCALSTSSSDRFKGVSLETMEGTTNGAKTRSIQRSGIAMVVVGAAVSIGNALTTDGYGRAIPVTGTNQSVLGTALTAASTAGDEIAVELELGQANAAGGLQCLEMQIEHTDLSDADTSQSFALGTVPANSWIVGYQMVLTEAFAKAAQTFIGQIGILGSLGTYADNLDVDGTPGTTEAAVSKSPETAAAVLCTITTNTGTLADSTAGDVTLRLFYMACTPQEVAAA
jgi:hypothetical protein